MTARLCSDFDNRQIADYRTLLTALQQGEISPDTAQTLRGPIDVAARAVIESYSLFSEMLFLQRELTDQIAQRRNGAGSSSFFRGSLPNGKGKFHERQSS